MSEKRPKFKSGIPLPKIGQRDFGLWQWRCRHKTVWHSLEQALTKWSYNYFSDNDDDDDDDDDIDNNDEIYYEEDIQINI
jgi:hypothetical protein